MSKPFFLLTGDDSVRAEGIILVRRIVEKFGDVVVIATKNQQSAVSGKINFKGGEWGKEIVDGFETIWVDGSPVDSINFAYAYLDRKPDFVISGMNNGENVDNASLGSGTFAAALRANTCRNVPAMAFSMEIEYDDSTWMDEQDGKFNEELLKYPGESMEKIIKMFMEKSKGSLPLWNVNFPKNATDKIKFCATYTNNYFPNNVMISENRFDYLMEEIDEDSQAADSDVRAMLDGYIAITPIKFDITDWEELEKLKS